MLAKWYRQASIIKPCSNINVDELCNACESFLYNALLTSRGTRYMSISLTTVSSARMNSALFDNEFGVSLIT